MLPVLFVSHGSPMLGLEPGPWGSALRDFALGLPDLKGVLVVSAHWEDPEPVRIGSAAMPATLHDFGGFPDALYELSYPAPGDPALAERALELLQAAGISSRLDPVRPLDHGAWVPLRAALPEAATPVLQVSLPRPRTPRQLFELGRALRPLREQGILLLGSGGIVHNLRLLDWAGDSGPKPWAEAFEAWVGERLQAGDGDAVLDRLDSAPNCPQAVPTREHFDPLCFVLGAADGAAPRTVFKGWQLGSLSLRCWAWD